MNRLVKSTLAGFYVLMAMTGLVQAQVEVLSPEQNTKYQQQLPAVQQSAVQPDFKSYLQTLKPNSSAARDIANAVRVANDVKAGSLPADAFFAHYAVPALSPAMRLPDAYPLDGEFGAEVGAVLAQDQYENASFVVYAFKDVDKVELKLSAFKSVDGSTLPAENLDLRVVKVWYQNGNAWLSYFADPGLTLVPELLLYDENLIRVDTKEEANYARIQDARGTREVWISAPQKLNVGFDPYQDGFADAKTLQPVQFVAGQFKQFFLTVRATASTKPGLYQGSVNVTAAGQKAVSIPVSIRVLPFQLPLPKTNYDINKDMIVSLMDAWPKHLAVDSKAMLPTLKNLRAHNILHIGPGVDPSMPLSQAKAHVELMKEAGFETKPIFGGSLPWGSAHDGSPVPFTSMKRFERAAKWYSDFYQEHFGHTEAYMKYGDEQGTKWMIATRPLWRIEHRLGLKSYIAGHVNRYFPTAGYVLEGRPTAGYPGEAGKTALWNQIGNGYTSFYAGQHNGAENPAFVRRQHGLEGYLSNFDMVNNYKFAYGPWNDLAWDLYKPMVLAYPISDGLVDTLAWEGFRAGIDDMRYATKLRQLATEAIDSGDLERMEAGRKVRQWFAMMDGKSVDLNAARMEMIEQIENLTQMSNAAK